MGKITLYDDTAKINAAYLYAASGNYSQVARDTNIPRTTIVSWANGDCAVWVDSLVKARQEISDEILAQNLAIAIKAGDIVLDRLENGDEKLVWDKEKKEHVIKRVKPGAYHSMLVSGISQDKARTQQNLPTSISSNLDSRALAEQCKELSRTMRDHRVVSVQKDSSVQEENNG